MIFTPMMDAILTEMEAHPLDEIPLEVMRRFRDQATKEHRKLCEDIAKAEAVRLDLIERKELERAVNMQIALAGGIAAEERLRGMIDWATQEIEAATAARELARQVADVDILLADSTDSVAAEDQQASDRMLADALAKRKGGAE
jgi:tRNA A37 threonylcarbamoyltransferase TsaD